MRIRSIHIENFGRLKDCDITFDTGLNAVVRENGWGKTSLAAFIRAMFYGLEGERKHDLKTNERLRYQPWNKGHFGGSMEFEAGGKRYIVTRDFGAKDRNDGFRLQDAVTLLDSTDYSERLGEELFHIDREAFGRTAFLNHASVLYSGGGSLPGDGEGTEAGAEDLNRYGIADEQMKKYLNENSPTRKTGKLFQKKDEIKGMEQELKRLAPLKERIAGLQEERAKDEAQLKASEEELTNIRAEQKTLQAFRTEALIERQREERKAYQEQCLAAVRETEREFGAVIPSEDAIKEAKTGVEKIRSLSDQLEAENGTNPRFFELTDYFGNGVPDAGGLEEQIRVINEIQDITRDEKALQDRLTKERGNEELLAGQAKDYEVSRWEPLAVWLFIGASCFLVALCLIMLTVFHVVPKKMNGVAIAGVTVLLAGAVFSVIEAVRVNNAFNKDKKAQAEKLAECRQSVSELEQQEKDNLALLKEKKSSVKEFLQTCGKSVDEGREEGILYEMKSRAEEYRSLAEAERERADKHEARVRERHEAENSLCNKLSEMGAPDEIKGSADTAAILNWLSEAGGRLIRLANEKKQAEEAEERLVAFVKEHPEKPGQILFSEEQLAERESDLNAAEAEASARERALREALSGRIREISDAYTDEDSLQDVSERLEALKEELGEAEKEYQIVKKTQEYLSAAKDRFTARFMEPIKTAFDKYYALLCGREDGGEEFRIDAGLRIERKEEGAFHDAEAQSDGYADMIGLCIRMAILDVKFTKEKPPVIMDDPLVYLDDAHLTGAKEFLQKIADRYQVIYLTCRGDRA